MSPAALDLREALAACPVIAILRGVRPEEIPTIAEALYAAGVRVVEVPLNSPQPLDSIARLASAFRGRLACGAGTVLQTDQVDEVVAAGGRVIVAPNMDASVIRRALELGAEPFPGFFTPSEAFEAVQAGATRLKLFPAGTLGPAYLRALKAVLDPAVKVFAVGGVRPDQMADWRGAGAAGFGLGSELYRPGQSADETFAKAQLAVAAARG